MKSSNGKTILSVYPLFGACENGPQLEPVYKFSAFPMGSEAAFSSNTLMYELGKIL